MRSAWRVLGVVALVSMCTMSASAVVIWDNGSFDGQTAYYSDPANIDYIAYDFFSLDATYTLTDVIWFGVYVDGAPDTDGFNYSILTAPTGASGTPGSEIYSGGLSNIMRSNSGAKTIGNADTIYLFSAQTSGFDIAAGDYFFSIYNTNPDPSAFAWCTSASVGGHEWSYSPDTDWWFYSGGAGLSFYLLGNDPVTPPISAIPEPATMTLVGLGIAGLWIRRRK